MIHVSRVIFFVLRHPRDPAWYGLARNWVSGALRIFRVRIVTRGREKLEPGRDYVILANHRSHFDVLAIIDAFGSMETRWVAKRELERVPIFGYGLRVTGQILVDRTDHEQALRELRKSLGDRGVSIVFFPEGHRADTRELLAFKKGGAAFAIEAGLPIVPVAVSGSDVVLPSQSVTALPGEIMVAIGDPIEVSSMTIDDRDALTSRVRDVIKATLRRLEGEPSARSEQVGTVGAHA